MKRGVIETLRRGVDNTIANWQLSAIRFGEMVLLTIISILAVIAMVVPILVSVGIHLADIKGPEDIESAVTSLLSKWVLLLWVLLGITVLLLVFVVIHSFVEAGCARVLVDGDRNAGPAVAGPRQRYRMFSGERWVSGAKSGWWNIFWIYNLAWGLGGLILLIPLIPVLALVLVFQENPAVAAGVGCVGLVVFMLFAIIVAVVMGMWTNRAIAQWAADQTGARATLRVAWRAVKSDLARHLLIALAIFVVAMAGSSFFASFSMFAAFGESLGRNASFNMITLPLRLVSSLLSSAFSALIASWYLASYSALAVEDVSSRA